MFLREATGKRSCLKGKKCWRKTLKDRAPNITEIYAKKRGRMDQEEQ